MMQAAALSSHTLYPNPHLFLLFYTACKLVQSEANEMQICFCLHITHPLYCQVMLVCLIVVKIAC